MKVASLLTLSVLVGLLMISQSVSHPLVRQQLVRQQKGEERVERCLFTCLKCTYFTESVVSTLIYLISLSFSPPQDIMFEFSMHNIHIGGISPEPERLCLKNL